MTEKYKKSTNW